MNYAVKLYKEGQMTFVKLQMCLGPHYIESYRKGTVDELYQNRKYIIENKFSIEVELYA